MKYFIPRNIIKGIVNKIKKLLTVVNEIDNATFPLKRYVMRFDVAPPGQAAIIIMPTLVSLGNAV